MTEQMTGRILPKSCSSVLIICKLMLLFHSVSDSRRSLLHEATTATEATGIHDADFMPVSMLRMQAAFPNSEGTAYECPCSKTLFSHLYNLQKKAVSGHCSQPPSQSYLVPDKVAKLPCSCLRS